MDLQRHFEDQMGEEIARTLRNVGFDLAGEHILQYYFYFPQSEQAQRLAARLSSEGFSCNVEEAAARESEWLCLAKHQTAIDAPALNELGKRFTALADDIGGQFDGWERAPDDGDTLPPALAMMAGFQLYQQGKLEQAALILSQVAESSTELAGTVWPLIGIANLKLGNNDEAIKALEKAVQAEPNDAENQINLGVAWHRLNNYECAISCYAKALETNLRHPSAHYNLACSYAASGRLSEALESLQSALSLNPKLRANARADDDLKVLCHLPAFQQMVKGGFSRLLSKIGL